MIEEVKVHIPELNSMKKYPKKLLHVGRIELLEKHKISIIGTRRPTSYTKIQTALLSSALASRGIIIVSGAAMGVDAIAHKNAKEKNTIAVMANGLDIRYPQVNKSLIEGIEKEGLTLSQFETGAKATPWSFVVRNEIVVALGDVLIVTEADLKSGSMRSVDYALKMQKKIYVLPHRIGESAGTNYLIKNGLAEVIYDVEEFVSSFGEKEATCKDDFLEYCKTNPSYEDAISKHKDKVFEYELEGKIEILNGSICLKN